jgi:site-specific DNA-cytosine methylase
MTLSYLSVCSGIEAATMAWHPLGWKPVAFSEIETFPSAVTADFHSSECSCPRCAEDALFAALTAWENRNG